MATIEVEQVVIPASITWREVDSSNVAAIGWPSQEYDGPGLMYVRFRNGQTYCYLGVSRQRAVWITRAESAGQYINQVIKPQYPSLRVPRLDLGH